MKRHLLNLDARHVRVTVRRCAESNCGLGLLLQVSDPVPLERFTIRGWAERRSAGRNALVTVMTPNTLVS